MNSLSASAIARIRECGPQDLANIAWAMAKLGLLHRPLIAAISAASIRMISAFGQQNLANMAWAFATLGVADAPLLASISAAALRNISDGQWVSQSLSNTAWAYASLDLLHGPLMASISAAAIARITEFNPQELMNTAWAFSTLGLYDKPLLQAISSAALARISEFNPHDLSGLAWSFSVLGYRDIPLMNAIASSAINRISEFRPQDLANTAWAFANIGVTDEPLLASISAAAIATITSFQPQDLGNTFWAYAKLEVPPGEELKDAISDAVLRRLSELEPQNLAMTAWAFSTLGIVNEPLMTAISEKAIKSLSDFATHDMANLLWSYPSLELEVECPLFARVRETLADRIPDEVSATLAKLAARTITPILAAEVAEFTNALLEFAWSFAFSEQEMGELAIIIRTSLLAIARAMDTNCLCESLLGPCSGSEPYNMGPNWDHELPSVILDLSGIVAVLKPPHWEVDARPGGSPLKSTDGGAPLLSSFLRRKYPLETYPLVHSNEQQFGIIHRLDTPSSGLILAGKNFVGYYTLRWQQDTYELGREYLVLCHGRMLWGPRVINAKIKTSRTNPVSSQVSEEGKPAWTQVEPLCVVNRGQGEEFSLIAIMIRTGRTHQIRVHLKFIGHPTVTDGKYTDQLVYDRDRSWCPRNFLHRYRLTFQDTEHVLREALAPLPKDLLSVLQGLCPADTRSAAMFHRLISGWVPNAGFV